MISPLAVLRLILRNLSAAAAIVMGSSLAGLLLVILWPVDLEYTAASRFIPEDVVASGQGSSFAQRLGLNSEVGGGGTAIEFYRELITSREILEAAASATYLVTPSSAEEASEPIRGELATFYVDVQTTRGAVSRLKSDIVVELSPATRLVRLETSAPWPDLALQINQQLLNLVENYNVERRRSEARAQREFVEARLEEVGQELRAAEEDLANFLERNRSWEASPQLTFEKTRLERTVDLRQGLYTQLAQSYENARISEVRNTPVLTMFEAPQVVGRSGRGSWIRGLVVGFIAGVFLAFAYIFLREMHHYFRREHEKEYSEILQLLKAHAPGRVVGRLSRRGRTATTERSIGDDVAKPKGSRSA